MIQYKYIIELPKSSKLENVTATEGTDATFNLKITGGKPKPQIKWFIEEEEIITIENEMYEVTEVEETVTLTVKNVKTENQGNYYAQLINDAGTTNSNKATLTVNRGPVFTKVPEPFEPIKPDESVKIEVVVDASPKPSINWYRKYYLLEI